MNSGSMSPAPQTGELDAARVSLAAQVHGAGKLDRDVASLAERAMRLDRDLLTEAQRAELGRLAAGLERHIDEHERHGWQLHPRIRGSLVAVRERFLLVAVGLAAGLTLVVGGVNHGTVARLILGEPGQEQPAAPTRTPGFDELRQPAPGGAGGRTNPAAEANRPAEAGTPTPAPTPGGRGTPPSTAAAPAATTPAAGGAPGSTAVGGGGGGAPKPTLPLVGGPAVDPPVTLPPLTPTTVCDGRGCAGHQPSGSDNPPVSDTTAPSGG